MSPTFQPAPGQTVEGRFLLLEELGGGGMSTVYKARDLSADRLVVVKIPLPEFATGLGSWSMFQREAEIGARLRHPSIVRFVTFTPNRRGLVVTEYVEGTSLIHRLRGRAPLPETEALALAGRLCEAVRYMHEHGVVHYDIKPGNVLLCQDGSLRLIDFGLAHAIEKGRFSLTGPTPAIASVDYAAPEQIRRRRGQASVDIYAIGAILYELLTGHPPFEGDDAYAVTSARRIGDPKPLRALNPAVSVESEEIVLRALRRNPAERYASAAALKADLDHPAHVRVTGLASRLIEVTPWRKRLRLATYVGAVGLAPIAGLVLSFMALWWYFAQRR